MQWCDKTLNYLLQKKRIIGYITLYTMFTMFFLVMVRIRLYGEILTYATFLENRPEEQFIYNLTSGMTIEQRFVSPHDFEMITLDCSNHEKALDGKIKVVVESEEDGKKLADTEIENRQIQFGHPLEIPLSETGVEGKEYRVRIVGIDAPEESVGFFGYLQEGTEGALVDGKSCGYVLSVGTHIYTGLFMSLFYSSLGVMLLGGVLSVYIIAKKDLPPERMFLAIAIPVGTAFLCFMSVNFIHDGDAHLPRAYHYANMLLGIKDENMPSAITVRKDDLEMFYYSECEDTTNAQNMWHIYETWRWFAEDKSLVSDVECRNVGTANILMYLPAVIGILLGRILGLGTYPMLYLAKLLSAGVYLAGAYYAIKLIPLGKHLLAFVAALPMAIQQAVGITYDNVTLAVLFLFIAFSMKLCYEKMSKTEWIGFGACCVLLGMCKGGIYSPMLVILLFIPRRSFGDSIKKKALIITAAGLLTVMAVLGNYGRTIQSYLHLYTDDSVAEINELIENSEEEPEGMLAKPIGHEMGYIFKEPVGFIKLLANTIIEKTDYYIKGLLGEKVAWAVEELPVWSYILLGIVLLLAKNGVGEEKYPVGGWLRLGLASSVGLVFLAYHILFLVETPLNNAWIWGIQGRYFIPQAVLLLLALRNNHVTQSINSDKMLYASYYMGLVLFLFGYLEVFMTQTFR